MAPHLSVGLVPASVLATTINEVVMKCDPLRCLVMEKRDEDMAQVMVINDDLSQATVLAELIEDRGREVVTCCDGHSAYDMLKQERPALVLLDLLTKKPETGWDVLTYLQIHPSLRSTPVIVCSGLTDDFLAKEEWLESHHIGVLTKPFELVELYEKVDKVLERK